MTDQVQEVIVEKSELNMDVVKFNVTDAEITKMKEEYMGLTINGIEDKAGFDKVYKARQAVKKTRVSLVKHADELKEKALTWQRKVNAEKNRVVGELESIEAHLQSEEDKIEAEKERIRVELEKKEQERIQKRIDRLAEYGFKVDLNFLQGLDDAAFDKVVENARIEFEKEQEQKKEQERQRKLEQEKLEAEKKELEKLRLQQAEAQRIIDENNRKQREEEARQEQERQRLVQQKIEARHDRIIAIGMTRGWDHFAYGKFQWKIDAIDNYSDEGFETELEETKKAVLSLKEEEQKKRQAEIEQAVKLAKEKALREKEEADRLKKEQEAEKLAQASDNSKFQVVIENLQSTLLNFPTMKSKKSQRLAESIKEKLKGLVGEIESATNSKLQKTA